jgi:hypothetical protein
MSLRSSGLAILVRRFSMILRDDSMSLRASDKIVLVAF